jgi:hypothetical protein
VAIFAAIGSPCRDGGVERVHRLFR